MVRTRNSGRSQRAQPSHQSLSRTSGAFGLRAQRKTTNYKVDSTDDSGSDSEQEDGHDRSHGHPGDTVEDSDSDASSGSDDLDSLPLPSNTRTNSLRLPSSAATRSRAANNVALGHPSQQLSSSKRTSNATSCATNPRKRRSAGSSKGTSPSKKQRKASSAEEPTITEMSVPDWRDPRIPYQAWSDIFLYAASEGTTACLDTNWLAYAATTCHTFAEPVLSALYRCPSIPSATKARKLADLLARPIHDTSVNYRPKIESLHLDIQIIPQQLLFHLISPLPRLKELIIYTTLDQPPYRELDKTIRWSYPQDIFNALLPAPEDAGDHGHKRFATSLKSWEWSGKLLGGYVPSVKDIAWVHELPSFKNLTRLSFTNFQVPSLHKPAARDDAETLQHQQEDDLVVDTIGNAINKLKNLRHLVFESSTVMTERLLSMLPKSLVHLELINCWEITSADLEAFLHSSGAELRTLSLQHNQSLSLEFLTSLAKHCPELRELRMNMSYYRHHETIDDGDALYEYALLPDQVPKWPNSIRAIEIEHIRDWPVEAAETFLQSLVDQAGQLSSLRHLAIKTNLDIPWQSRAAMRREWRVKMDEVFLRPFEPPKDRRVVDQQAALQAEQSSVSPKKRRQQHYSPSRRSGRLASRTSGRGSRSNGEKGLRHKPSKPLYKDPDTDEDEFDASDSDGGDDTDHASEDAMSMDGDPDATMNVKPVIQGKCITVSITLDNQKVREMQYGMEDFQDSDDASEEEWSADYDEDDTVIAF